MVKVGFNFLIAPKIGKFIFIRKKKKNIFYVLVLHIKVIFM